MNGRPRVAVVFGGRSAEHEISIQSAQSVIAALGTAGCSVIPVGIDRNGNWHWPCPPERLLALGDRAAAPSRPDLSQALRLAEAVDIVFPVLHGTFGEDGTIQGLLEMAAIPFVGSGVLGSAAGMDKAVMKSVFSSAGISTPRWVLVQRPEWRSDPAAMSAKLICELGLPMYVKPANLGSSVGVSLVTDADSLPDALARAAKFDSRLICERAVQSPREIEIGILGNDDPLASVPGEVFPGRDFYDYRAKYDDLGTTTQAPAKLSEELAKSIADTAIRAYRALDLAGLARADFLLERPSGKLYLSEVNTMPGFTSISMYPKLWEASGLPYPELLERLIELGFERARQRETLLPATVD